MNPGELRDRVVIQSKAVITFDNNGDPAENWSPHATLWAKAMIGAGREYYGAKRTNAELSGIIQIRHNKSITEQMRVEFDGAIYDIIAVIHNPDRQITELHVKAVR